MKLRGTQSKVVDMLTSMTLWAAGRSPNDQPLTKAARVALEADPTPRYIVMTVDHDGLPIEIPGGIRSSQIELPLEASKE